MEPTDRRLYNPRVDQLRAVGFLAVSALHFFKPTYAEELGRLPGSRFFAPFILNGYFGVSLFFLLSGYILSRLAIEQGGGRISYGTFLLNRVLRIYPLWVICLLLVMYQGQISGSKMISLLLLFVQDLPPTPWNVAWSVQQEFYLYLLFPIMFANLTRVKHLFAVIATCIAVRLSISYNMSPDVLRDVSYSTIMGTVTVFATGMMLARLPRVSWPPFARRLLLAVSIALIWGVASLIEYGGGFFFAKQSAGFTWFWFFYPEIMAISFGALLFTYDIIAPPAQRGPVSATFSWLGKISYSGYLFHVALIDFVRTWLIALGLRAVVNPFLEFAIYLVLLIGLASISFTVIEKPFLTFRKRYVAQTP